MRTMVWPARIALAITSAAAAASGLAARPLYAQPGRTTTFVAGVADAETGEALEGAEVILVRLRLLARTNGIGEATITQVLHGVQRVRVRRLGYAPVEIDLAFSRDTTGAVFRLQKSVTQLGAVNVEADWMPPKMKDVEIRRKQGIGRFLTEVELEPIKDRDFVLTMATRFPGLYTVTDPMGRRALASGRSVQGLTGGLPCLVTVYLDDIELPKEDADVIRVWDLAVVEFYTSSQAPVRYRAKSPCGVLLLWSKWY